MTPRSLAQFGTLLFSLLCMSFGFLQIGVWGAPIWLLVLVLVWRAASQQGLPGANGLLVVGLYAAAAIGLGLGAQTFLMVTSAIASLAAWDLMELSRTLEQVGSDFPSVFVKAHTGALGIVLISSAGLALLAVALDGQLPFAAIFGLALLLAASLFFSMKVLETPS